MEDDYIYNPSTDNLEKMETPRLNPATGIRSDIIKTDAESRRFRGKIVRPVYVAGQPIGFKEVEGKPFGKKEMIQLAAKLKAEDEAKKKAAEKRKSFYKKEAGKLLIPGYARKSRPLQDQLKVLRLQNMLDKKRLLNQIQKLKLAKQIESLKRKGKLQQVVMTPIMKQKSMLYPAYATPETMGDIDSAFFSDIGHADGNLWGGENYYDEEFYGEKYWDDEFNLSPWEHLQIKPQIGVSPLLW